MACTKCGKAKERAQKYTKSKKKGSMKGMTVKGGHKLPTSRGAGLTAKDVRQSTVVLVQT